MKKMYILLSFLLVILIVSNTFADLDFEKNQKKAFLRLIFTSKHVYSLSRHGHLSNFPKNTGTCVYNTPPNPIAKQAIDEFYQLLSTELHIFSMPVYTQLLKDCPINTGFYVHLHETGQNKKQLADEYLKVVSRHNIPARSFIEVNPMGFFVTSIYPNKSVGFTSINQITTELKDIDNEAINTYLKGSIIEELFQMVVSAGDVTNQKVLMSIIHESYRNNGYIKPHQIKKMKQSLINNPNGLCGYDLWLLILLSKYEETFINYKNFKIRFNDDYKKIKKRAEEIENNPVYKDLFDPRCSGKNTGLNSKIGIE